jgi:hypothetical protein
MIVPFGNAIKANIVVNSETGTGDSLCNHYIFCFSNEALTKIPTFVAEETQTRILKFGRPNKTVVVSAFI